MEKKFKFNHVMEIEGNLSCSGIYGIFTKDSDTCLYIGSSQEINDAKDRHLHYLRYGKYYNTNKNILQRNFILDNLVFRVLVVTDDDEEMNRLEKQMISECSTCCNFQRNVKRHSSNQSKLTTWKRRTVNLQENNPNCKLSLIQASEILWLKLNTKLNQTDISKLYGVSIQQVNRIGVTRWLYIEPIKPEWYILSKQREKEWTETKVQSI